MANISGLYTALSGMQAHRRVLDTTAHNLANQATPGFHRQRVELRAAGLGVTAGVFAGTDNALLGVTTPGVQRLLDQYAEQRATREYAAQAGTQTLQTNLDRIESTFREPSDDGLAAQLDAFWAGWSDVSTHPDDLGARTQLLERAQGVIDALRGASTDLDAVEQSARVEVDAIAADINDLAAQIADLNSSIVATGGTANDLLDRRDLLVNRLAELSGAVARPSALGAVDVLIGGRAIVTGTTSQTVDTSGGVVTWTIDGAAVNASPSRLQALNQTIGDIVPKYRAALDGVAATLVTEVNTLHSGGYDLSGATGRDFFDPAGLSAATIGLSGDVAGQPAQIAAGAPVLPGPTPPGPLDGELAREIAAIADRATGPDSEYRSLVSTLGAQVSDATRRNSVQAQVALNAATAADSVGGVSVDEEMANLIAAQRAYEASARVLTTVDEMLGVLMRTGVVGR